MTPLPKPVQIDRHLTGYVIRGYTAKQMHDYARAAVGAERDAARVQCDALRALLAEANVDAARYRWLAARMAHVSHPNGPGWTLDEVLTSHDRDLGEVIDAALRSE